MNKFFNEVNNNFGFGCMRLPMKGNDVDLKEFSKMVDAFIKKGFNYFDTAHVYIGGKSEEAIKECVSKRYKRNEFILANKLSNSCFKSNEEIRPFFNMQLEKCGVDYFDFYLMHSQNKENFEKFKACKAYEECFKLKEEGKIKHVGFSFHDKPDVLDEILTCYPEFEFVQIQFNYLDYLNEDVLSKACYDVCVKHHKPVIIMEPIRGGRLINLPVDGMNMLKANNLTPSNIALRFCASFENVMMVLSGMSNLEQMNDNLSFMTDFINLNKKEMELAFDLAQIIKNQNQISCTGCKYCVSGCPQNINIPALFYASNQKNVYNDWSSKEYYRNAIKENGNPIDCIKCGNCESVCPQHLKIRDLLEKVYKEFN